ncbi:MAG TPA: AzlD domain-containing protein [Xanthobacteraceae bacterium]
MPDLGGLDLGGIDLEGPGTIAAILAMGAVTYSIRAGGFWLMGHVPLTARVRRMLEALPGTVVVATVLPITVREGAPAILAVAAAVGAMMVRRNDFLAVIAGMAVAALARAWLG